MLCVFLRHVECIYSDRVCSSVGSASTWQFSFAFIIILKRQVIFESKKFLKNTEKLSDKRSIPSFPFYSSKIVQSAKNLIKWFVVDLQSWLFSCKISSIALRRDLRVLNARIDLNSCFHSLGGLLIHNSTNIMSNQLFISCRSRWNSDFSFLWIQFTAMVSVSDSHYSIELSVFNLCERYDKKVHYTLLTLPCWNRSEMLRPSWFGSFQS